MRAGSRMATAICLALSTTLVVPSVHWCAIPWEQVRLECLARCWPAPGPECEAPCAHESGRAAAVSAPADESPPRCAESPSCPLAHARSDAVDSPRPAKRGRAYLVNEVPHGVAVRGLGLAIAERSLALAPLPSPIVVEAPIRPAAWPPTPEVRPPTLAWTTVRLARAPPARA